VTSSTRSEPSTADPAGTITEDEPKEAPEAGPSEEAEETGEAAEEPRLTRRRVAGWAVTGLSALFVLFALLLPIKIAAIQPRVFVRIPVEAVLGAGLVLILPSKARRPAAAVMGAGLGLLLIVKILDAGFYEVLVRWFDPVLDWALIRPGVEFVASSFGTAAAIGVCVAVVLLVVGVVIGMALAAVRLAGLVVRHSLAATGTVAVLGPAWIVCAALGAQLVPGVAVTSKDSTVLTYKHLVKARATLRDKRAFAAAMKVDAFRDTPGDRLLTALRGKDVVLTFVESYGRTSIETEPMASWIDSVLANGDRRLRAAGFGSRSAFLTSSTAGGSSWLAHATLLSGLWVSDQQRYRILTSSDRLTLNRAFQRAQWRSVGVMPGIMRAWPEGSFYGYDKVYTSRDLGYRGPSYGWVTMPDQYTLAAFQRLEGSRKGGPPVMAEIPLLSSHATWSNVPTMVGWDRIGDGSVFYRTPATNHDRRAMLSDPRRARTEYARSIVYSLESLISYTERYGDDDLVLIFLGDHEPLPLITGPGAGRDVPITVVTRDRAVLDRIAAAWHWQDGLNPDPRAPVWPMSAFRDRFLRTFSSP
jgi:hypothetical protein